MKIELSTDLKMPLDAVTQTFAFLARRGAGKTYGAMKLAEEFLAAAAQVVVLDPVGVWWGLRLDANGRSKGFDIPVFGGEHGDIPLEPTGGALVARAIVEHGISVVLDVSHFRKNQRKQFCTDLAEELFHLKKKHRSPMHLFVEEAQVFVPQKTFHGDERMLGAFEDIIKLGRNYGIGATLISQRPQAVNKDVLNQTECLVVLQTNGKQERTALAAWMEEKDVDFSMLGELPKLDQGDAFVWSPSWLKTFQRIHIAKKRTFNASATPEVGKAAAARQLAPIDLGALETAMKESVERVKATDPKALQAEITRLRAELGKAAKAAVAPAPAAEPKIVEVSVVNKEDLARLERGIERIDELRDHLAQAQQIVASEVDLIRIELARVKNQPPARATATALRPSLAKPATISSITRRPAPEAAAGGVPRPQQRILDALAWLLAFGIAQPTRNALAAVCRVKASTGTFRNNLGALRTAGLIEYPLDNHVELTPSGSTAASPPDIPATNEAMQQAVMEVATGPQAAILRIVIAAYPSAVSRVDIAAELGVAPTTGSFRNNLGAARTLGALDYPADGMVVATSMLFPLPVAA